MKWQLDTLGGGLIMAVFTLALIAIILFVFITAFPPEITQDQLTAEANSIWGNMTTSEQNDVWRQYTAWNGMMPDRTLDQYLIQVYGPQPPPRMP